MAVHRGDQTDGQGRTELSRLPLPVLARFPEPAPSGCPIAVVHRDGDIGTKVRCCCGTPEAGPVCRQKKLVPKYFVELSNSCVLRPSFRAVRSRGELMQDWAAKYRA
jgi:hypothetical protein